MTSKNIFSSLPVDYASLGKRMLIGGVVALVLIIAFLYPTNPNPNWGNYWMVRPLIVVPFAGAVGGACNYFLVSLSTLMGWNKALAYILSFIIFIFGLWIGTVLGLAGTLWN
jgi:hypothetical protein